MNNGARMKVICIIPARYGSTRFEGKPLANLCGKSMIQRTYEQVKKSKLIDEIYIATDDNRIKDNAGSFGAKVLMTSREHVCGTDRIAEAVRYVKSNEDDVIINVQGDEPLVDPRALDAVIRPLLKDPKLYMACLITKIKDKSEYKNPNVVKVVKDRDNFALYCSRSLIPYSRYDISRGVYKQIGVYVYRKGFLVKFSRMEPTPYEKIEKLEQLRALENGFKMKLVETDYDSVPVDVPEDLKRVIDIIKRKQ